MPKGVTVVAVLTLLGAIGYFFTWITLTALGASGHPGVYIDPAEMLQFYTLTIPALALSILCLIASIGILIARKFSWYMSIGVWISSIVYVVYVAPTPFGTIFSVGHGLVASIILVNIVLIMYFQTEGVKRYFKIKQSSSIMSESDDR